MAVQLQTQNPGFHYDSIVSRFNEVAKSKGVDASLSVGDTGLSLTIGDAEGSVRTIPISVPDLDAPAAASDPETLENITAQLDALAGQDILSDDQLHEVAGLVGQLSAILSKTEASEAGSTANAAQTGATGASGVMGTRAAVASKKSILFDIYALLALMQEVAQEQRNTAREIRQQENQNIISQIQSQAAKQRWAAVTGVIATAVICAVQVAAITYQTSAAGKAASTQANIADSAGSAQANADLKTAVKIDAQLGDAKAINASVEAEALESPVGQEAINELKADFAGTEAVKGDLVKKEQTAIRAFDVAQQTKLQGVGLTNKADIDAHNAELTTAQNQVRITNDRVTTAQRAYTTQYNTDFSNMSIRDSQQLSEMATQKANLENQVNTLRTENTTLENANAQMQEQNQQLQARNNELYAKGNRTPQEQAELDQNIASIDANGDEMQRNSQKIQENQTKLADLEPKLTDATTKLDNRTKIVELKQKLASTRMVVDQIEHGADYRIAQKGLGAIKNQAGSIQNMVAANREFIAAAQRQTMAQAKLNYYQAYGQMANSLVQGVSNWINADATETGAYRQQAEENWNMVKEIFDQAEDLIRSVRQLMLQILQTENQSIQSVINKI